MSYALCVCICAYARVCVHEEIEVVVYVCVFC